MDTYATVQAMDGPTLVRAYNALAAARQTRSVTRFSDRKTALTRTEASLRIALETHDVALGEDGGLVVTHRGRESSVGRGERKPEAEPETVEARVAPQERRVSPGLARLRRNLGDAGTEALRAATAGDSDAALAEAARRSDTPAGSPTAPPAESTPPLDWQRPAETAGQRPTPAEAAQRDRPTSPEPPPPRAARGRPSGVADTDVIRVRISAGHNPKRAGAGLRYAKYYSGMTVAEYAAAITGLVPPGTERQQAARDVQWDESKGWISIESAAAAGR